LLLVSAMVFFTMHLLPGDPAELMLAGAEGGAISSERLAELRQQMGLDDPVVVQYGRFLWRAAQGDLGTSIRFRSPVTEKIREQLPFTLRLASAGMAVAIVLGVTLGTLAAVFRHTIVDTVAMTIAFVGASMPIFWLGLILILTFAMNLRLFPTSGTDSWLALVLPAITLGFVSAAVISRLVRSSLLELFGEDFVRTARSKGRSAWGTLLHHVAKNAMIPVVTMFGLQFGGMLAGTVVTEVVFSRPGVGRLIVNAILWKDYPLVQGSVLFLSTLYVGVNLAVDVVYAYLDPRIRFH
jgi:peptide/nickel transport system permease protein